MPSDRLHRELGVAGTCTRKRRVTVTASTKRILEETAGLLCRPLQLPKANLDIAEFTAHQGSR